MDNNQTDIRVSVIVPVYNSEKYLEETIASIEKQTLKDIEAIFVDDGSTDSSPDILARYKNGEQPPLMASSVDRSTSTYDRHIKNVTVIRQKNQYAGVARNNGLKHAQGKYVAFWDADDFSDPTQLEKLYDQCEKTGAEVGVCGMYSYNQQTKAYRRLTTVINKKLLPEGKTVFAADELQEVVFNAFSFHSPNKIFLRSFLMDNDIRYSSDRISEDTIFIMKALLLAKKIAIVDEPLYVYRVNEGTDNLTSTIADDIMSKVRAFREMKAYLVEEGLMNEKIERSFANKVLSGCVRHMRLTGTYESYVKMYDYLVKENGLQELSITSDESDYYYSPKDFERYQTMKRLNDANEYLYWDKMYGQDVVREKDRKLREAKETIKRLKAENKKIKSSKAYRYATKVAGLKKAMTGK